MRCPIQWKVHARRPSPRQVEKKKKNESFSFREREMGNASCSNACPRCARYLLVINFQFINAITACPSERQPLHLFTLEKVKERMSPLHIKTQEINFSNKYNIKTY